MLWPSFFTYVSTSLPCFWNCRPYPAQDSQPARISGSETTQTFGLESIETSGLQYTEEPPAIETTDITDQFYLSEHGYYASFFPNSDTRVYSRHYGKYGAEAMLHIFFDEERYVAIIRDNKLCDEKDHEDKLPLHRIFKAVSHAQGVKYYAMDWIVMDIDSLDTLGLINDYHARNNLPLEEDIRLTQENIYWDLFADTNYYKQASQMIPWGMDKIIIRRQERVIEGTDYPTTVTYLIMFSFKSHKSEGQEYLATDPAEIRAMENVEAAIDAVDKTQAAYLKAELDSTIHDDIKTPEHSAESASESSELEATS
ncbi:hypothetical protein CFIMG_006509RA [Ceratocystis fimbriata CBS 114723]|uniref:Uncharacterized protein n=1 Tax=Ceratocystis fimbriata CBS 114723 TaxID=1035309 RepID=A0A2C5WIK2_9PEZI|nr:hypothetical protein CFIMG_006509RA [Ceratocystis fimbriata CBS 114723]